MASSKKRNQSGYVDISSNSQVNKVYKKKCLTKKIIIIVLSIIFLISGSGLLYYYSFLESFNYNYIGNTMIKGSNDKDNPDDIGSSTSLTYDGKTLLSDSKVLNVMLFGAEKGKGEKYGRSDSMILLSVDNRNKKLKLTTFMRDTLVYVPGYDQCKLTEAYSFGGPALSIETIESNFGIKVDRYAVVDYESFKSIVDVLGGVDIELTAEEIDYINLQMYINNQSDTRNTITDPPGSVHLNGLEALWHARNRGFEEKKYPNDVISGDDWDRTNRQRDFISTLFERFKSSSLTQVISIASQVGPYVTTNFKKDEITTLLANATTYLKYESVEYSVPGKLSDIGRTWKYPPQNSGLSHIDIIDMDTVRKEFAKFVFEDLVKTSGSSSN